MLRKVINLFHEQDGDGDGQRESVTWKLFIEKKWEFKFVI